MPKFLGEIVQNGGDFALLDSSNVRGGFMQLSTIEELHNIIPDKLKEHMIVHVAETGKMYEFMGDNWIEFSPNKDIEGHQFLTVHHRVLEVTEEEEYYKIIFDGDLFEGNDLIGYQIDDNLNGIYSKIEYIRDGAAYISKDTTPPNKYDECYLVGSTSNRSRQVVLVYHRYNGAIVLSQFLNIALENINENYFFRVGQHGVNSWKVYGEDVYFKGTFIDEKGRDLSSMISYNQTSINTGFTAIREEFGYDNLLNNPYFVSGLDCWISANTANFFTLKGKWILTNKTILSTKRDGAFVIDEEGRNVLRIVSGYVAQRNEFLRKIVDLDEKICPYYVTVIFSYMPVTDGTLTVSMTNEDSTGYTEAPNPIKATTPLVAGAKYETFRASFLWNGTGDFKVAYTGEIKIQTLVLKVNEVKNLELKYKDIFDKKDTLIQMINMFETQIG